MYTSKALATTVTLLKEILSLQYSLSYTLNGFYKQNNKHLKSSEIRVITDSIYLFLRNYNKLTSSLPLTNLEGIVAFIWFNYLDVDLTTLKGIKNLANLDVSLLDLKPVDNLANTTELPQWLLDDLVLRHSEEFITELANSMEKPLATLSLRVNMIKLSRDKVLKQLLAEGFNVRLSELSKYGIILQNKADLSKHPLVLNGSLEVQSEASQLAGILLNPLRGEMIADFGAGSGGKSLLFAAMMRNTGQVYAIDNNHSRLKNLTPRLQRSGLNNIYPTLINDEYDSKLEILANKMDKVFVDVPCSGSGTLSSNPELKLRYGELSVAKLNQLQLSILTRASKLVKSGGWLVYATCSIAQLENADIIQEFLQQNPNFKLKPAIESLVNNEICSSDGRFMQLYPHVHKTEGFFAALIHRFS